MEINIKERITGFDVCEHLLNYASINKKKVYLFGSKEEVIDGMQEVIKNKIKGETAFNAGNCELPIRNPTTMTSNTVPNLSDNCTKILGINTS